MELRTPSLLLRPAINIWPAVNIWPPRCLRSLCILGAQQASFSRKGGQHSLAKSMLWGCLLGLLLGFGKEFRKCKVF